ncbi:MAG TPA: DMT family transporter [Limnobacter sp.]|nr:DMT family transporter [Limnobacter sp.]
MNITNLFLLWICGGLISITYAMGKIAAQHQLAGLSLLYWQIVGASAIVLAAASRAGQWPSLSASHVRYYLLAGLMGFTLPYLLTYHVLQTLPSGVVGVIASLSPLITYGLVLLVKPGAFGWIKALGLLIGFAGVLAILLPKSSLPAPDLWTWALLACVSPLLLACGNLYRTTAWPKGGLPIQMASGLLLTQLLLLTPPFIASGAELPPPQSWPVVAGAALGSGLFYLLAFKLQQRTTPVYVGQLGYVIALCSMLLGIAMFDEQISAWLWLGASLIAVGVVLVSVQSSNASGAVS